MKQILHLEVTYSIIDDNGEVKDPASSWGWEGAIDAYGEDHSTFTRRVRVTPLGGAEGPDADDINAITAWHGHHCSKDGCLQPSHIALGYIEACPKLETVSGSQIPR